MRNRTWILITLTVVLSWVLLAGICRADDPGDPVVPGEDLLGFQYEEAEFDPEATNEWMRRYVLENPPEPKATEQHCPPGFDCRGPDGPVTPGIRASVERLGAGIEGFDSAIRAEGHDCLPGFTSCVAERHKRSFWNWQNLVAMGFQFGGAFADMKTSMDGLALEGAYDGFVDGSPGVLIVSVHEGDGPEERYMREGWGKFALFKAAINVPLAIGAHYFSESDHGVLRAIGWVLRGLQGFMGGIQWGAAYDNHQFNRDMRRQIDDFQRP